MTKKLFFENLESEGKVVLTDMNTDSILTLLGKAENREGLHKAIILDTETTKEMGMNFFYQLFTLNFFNRKIRDNMLLGQLMESLSMGLCLSIIILKLMVP
jgi:hypothetical protein